MSVVLRILDHGGLGRLCLGLGYDLALVVAGRIVGRKLRTSESQRSPWG